MGRKIGEFVWWNGSSWSFEATSRRASRGRGTTAVTTAETASASASASETTTKSTSGSKSATTSESTAAKSTTAKASTAAKLTGSWSGKAVFANLKGSTLPFVAIELLNGIARIIRAFKGYNASALRASTWIDMNIGTNDGSLLRCPRVNCKYQGSLRRWLTTIGSNHR